jgi:hypothetical protein
MATTDLWNRAPAPGQLSAPLQKLWRFHPPVILTKVPPLRESKVVTLFGTGSEEQPFSTRRKPDEILHSTALEQIGATRSRARSGD